MGRSAFTKVHSDQELGINRVRQGGSGNRQYCSDVRREHRRQGRIKLSVERLARRWATWGCTWCWGHVAGVGAGLRRGCPVCCVHLHVDSGDPRLRLPVVGACGWRGTRMKEVVRLFCPRAWGRCKWLVCCVARVR